MIADSYLCDDAVLPARPDLETFDVLISDKLVFWLLWLLFVLILKLMDNDLYCSIS